MFEGLVRKKEFVFKEAINPSNYELENSCFQIYNYLSFSSLFDFFFFKCFFNDLRWLYLLVHARKPRTIRRLCTLSVSPQFFISSSFNKWKIDEEKDSQACYFRLYLFYTCTENFGCVFFVCTKIFLGDFLACCLCTYKKFSSLQWWYAIRTCWACTLFLHWMCVWMCVFFLASRSPPNFKAWKTLALSSYSVYFPLTNRHTQTHTSTWKVH